MEMEIKKKMNAPSWVSKIKDRDEQLKQRAEEENKTEGEVQIVQLERESTKMDTDRILKAIEDISEAADSKIDAKSLSSVKLKGEANKVIDFEDLKSTLGTESVFKEKMRTAPIKNEQSILDLVLIMSKYDGVVDSRINEKEKYLEEQERLRREREEERRRREEEERRRREEEERRRREAEANIPEPEPIPEPPKPEVKMEQLEDDGTNILDQKPEEPEVPLPDIDLSKDFSDEDSKTYSLKDLNDKYSLSPDTQV